MNNSLLSKYIPLNTIIHKLDARSKLFFVFLYFINVFVANTICEFSILFLILLITKLLSKVSFSYLISGFKVILLLIFFTSLVHLIFNTGGEIIFSLWGFSLYSGALKSIMLIIIRFFLVVSLMIIFNITTSPSQITHAIEKSLGFLQNFKIPVSTFALLMSISLRFIPTIGEETTRIMNAQISRGANFKTGTIFTRMKNFVPILIPIFVATVKRADELATAMEVRGYNPDAKRTKYKILKYSTFDYIVYFIIVFVTIIIVFL